MSARIADRPRFPLTLAAALLLGIVATAASGQVGEGATTLLCTPVAEAEEEGLYRCAPATVVGGEIVATRAPATVSLLQSEFEGLCQKVAELRLLLSCVAAECGEEAAGVEGGEGADSGPPANDLLWRTLDTEIGTPAPPPPAPERPQRFTPLEVAAGAGDGGEVTITLRGRYFSPLAADRAVQAEGGFLYSEERQELALDLGLVQRLGSFQLGLFAGAKHLGFRDLNDAASLVQASLTADWVFGRGRLGIFAAAGVRDTDVVDRRSARRNFQQLTFVQVVDQLGVGGRLRLSEALWVEGSAAYLDTADGSEGGGHLRFVRPLGPRWALFVEGGWNEGLVTPDGGDTRLTVGLRAGAWPAPGEPAAPTGPEGPPAVVPVEIPSLRYELRSRERRLANDFPIADAGPDQRLAVSCPSSPCTVTVRLDGSASFDPDGDPLSYAWTPRAGFDAGETIQGANEPQASFTAREGRRYVVRLTVSDGEGSGFDEVEIIVERRRAAGR